MITEYEKPVWYDYLELDAEYNQRLRNDAPPEVQEAYKQHLEELSIMTKEGTRIYKA